MLESLQQLVSGFGIATTVDNLFYCIIGAIVGTLIGVLPGIGPIAGIALLIPATFTLNPTSAIIMLAGIYYGAMYGGSTTSILLNVPGETASVITCIDAILDPAPPDLLAVEFEAWLHTQGEPTWLFEDGNAPFLLGDKMRKTFEKYLDSWKEWFAEVINNNLLKTATLGDWYTVISGGKEVWSFRSERIFKDPSERATALGWASPTDI